MNAKKRSLLVWLAVGLLAAPELAVNAQGQGAPSLSIQWLTNSTVRIAWTKTMSLLVLEESGDLLPGNVWQEVAEPTVALGDGVSVTLDAAAASRFFRLRSPDIGVTIGGPPVEVVFPSTDEVDTGTPGVTMGRPPVEVVFPVFDEINATGGLIIGRPPVEVVFPSLDEVNSGSGVTFGRPPLEVLFPALDEIDSILTGITLGRPPVSIRYVP
jgi:hypothetical protein